MHRARVPSLPRCACGFRFRDARLGQRADYAVRHQTQHERLSARRHLRRDDHGVRTVRTRSGFRRCRDQTRAQFARATPTLLDGEKTWISNAGIAGVYVVFARTADTGAKGFRAFVVPASNAGLVGAANASKRSRRIRSAPCVSSSVAFRRKTVWVKKAKASKSRWRRSTCSARPSALLRSDSPAARLTKRVRTCASANCSERRWPRCSSRKAKIAHMATEIDASALLVYRAAYEKDAGAERITREAAMAKWFATETAARAADSAVQLFGGRGVTRGEIVERLYRDVRALRIYEGASEIQQIVIARSVSGGALMAAERARRYVRRRSSAAARTVAGLDLYAAGAAVSAAAELRRSAAGSSRARRERRAALHRRTRETWTYERFAWRMRIASRACSPKTSASFR